MPANNPFIGQIAMFGGTFAPRGWAFCNGQLLAINTNQALFSLLGTIYGGDGRTTFALPALRGRVPINAGNGSQGPGLPTVSLGEKGGNHSVTLTAQNLPAHAHALTNASDDVATSSRPEGNVLATTTEPAYADASLADMRIGPSNTENTGNNQSFDNRQPYLGLNYIIALEGVFPSRS